MGRPSITEPTIVVAIDQELLVWTEGLLSGTDYKHVKQAKYNSELGIPVKLALDGPTVQADLYTLDHPERVVAAMMSVNPGRALILEAPQEVYDLLDPYIQSSFEQDGIKVTLLDPETYGDEIVEDEEDENDYEQATNPYL